MFLPHVLPRASVLTVLSSENVALQQDHLCQPVYVFLFHLLSVMQLVGVFASCLSIMENISQNRLG